MRVTSSKLMQTPQGRHLHHLHQRLRDRSGDLSTWLVILLALLPLFFILAIRGY